MTRRADPFLPRALAALLALLPVAALAVDVQPWPLPAPAGAAQPQLVADARGDLLLAWIEPRAGGGHRYRFARHDAAGRWSQARTVAEGADWFVNWADVPSLVALPDGRLWAHLLVKNGEAAYAYDLRLTQSADGGRRWTPLRAVHDDGTATEHGFASLWAQGDDAVGVAWLDGRRTAGADHGGGHDGHGGAMTLRAAVLDPDGGKRQDVELDAMTCDCCQTDVAATDRGLLLVYRDRGPGEIRDIAATRFDGQAWTAPVTVHADQWFMPACPVNGPAVAARGGEAWVAWYTAAGGTPRVRLARSRDAGDRFGAPRTVAEGEAVQGRVDLAMDGQGPWVLWLEEAAGRQSLWLARYRGNGLDPAWRVRVAELSGRGRGTGVPRLRLRDGVAYLAWTELVDGQPRLAGAIVRP